MKEQILSIIASSNIEIKSQEKLFEYISFCLENNTKKKIKNVTEHHHILPKATTLFEEYSDLRIHKWNGVHLTYEHHYIAHSKLVYAVDHVKVIYGWNRMNIHFSIEDQIQIIGSKKYKELREKHRQSVIHYNKTRILTDETRKKMSEACKKRWISNEFNKMKKKISESNKGFVTTTNIVTGEKKRVTKEEYDSNDNLVGNTVGMITVKDIRNNKMQQVSKNDFEKYDYYQHNTKGMVAVIDIRDSSTKQVTKEEYENTDYYVGMGAKKLSIFDNNGHLKYSLPLSFFRKSKELYNLPKQRILLSSRNNGLPINFVFKRKCEESLIRNKGWFDYQGWYAISEAY